MRSRRIVSKKVLANLQGELMFRCPKCKKINYPKSVWFAAHLETTQMSGHCQNKKCRVPLTFIPPQYEDDE